jgi:outer membrane protein TolC
MKHMLHLQENQVVYERSKLFPAINLFGRVSNQLMYTDEDNSPDPNAIVDPDYISYTVGLQLQWTIFDGWRSPSTFQKTKVRKKKTEIRLQRTEKQMRIGVDRIRSNLSTTETMLEAVEIQRRAARQAYDATQTDFEAGAVDITTLLEAEQQWMDAEKQYNSLYTQKIALATQLKLLLGIPVYTKGSQ